MQEMHSKRPKYSKFSGGEQPGPPKNLTPSARVFHSPPTPTILPPTQILIENPVTAISAISQKHWLLKIFTFRASLYLTKSSIDIVRTSKYINF